MDDIALLIILAALALFGMYLDWIDLKAECRELNEDEDDTLHEDDKG